MDKETRDLLKEALLKGWSLKDLKEATGLLSMEESKEIREENENLKSNLKEAQKENIRKDRNDDEPIKKDATLLDFFEDDKKEGK